MVNKIILICWICFSACSSVFSADLNVKGSLVHHYHHLADLKDWHASLTRSFQGQGLFLETTDHFEQHPAFAIQLDFASIGPLKTGVYYSQISTGGRSAIHDPTGSFLIDHVISSQVMGLALRWPILKSRINLYGTFKPLFLSTTLGHREELTILEKQESSLSFKAHQWAIEPGLTLCLPYRIFFLDIECAYQMASKNTLKRQKGQSLMFLEYSLAQSLSVDWSGLKLSLSLGLSF